MSADMALMPSAGTMFCHSTACARRERRTVSAMRRRLSFITTMPSPVMAVGLLRGNAASAGR